jgi:hypothetical protein
MVDSVLVNNDVWNRQVDLLNMITYGQIMIVAGEMKKNLRQIYGGCDTILTTLAPMYVERIEISKDDHNKGRAQSQRKGIDTAMFTKRQKEMYTINNLILYSEHPDFDRRARHYYAQVAYNRLQTMKLQLFQDVESLGFNKREKVPGSAAALTGA